MNVKVNFNTVFTSLVTALFIFAAGAIWDFQNLKGRVSATEKQVLNIGDKLGVVAKLTCKRAIEDNLPDAVTICAEVLKSK